MNVITIAGNLGKDIEIRRTPNGDAVGSFSVGDSQGQDKPTIWWRCQLWGKRAEALAPFLLKGQPVTVSGEVTEREYTDKDNQQRKAQEVRVNNVKLQGSKQGTKTSGIQFRSDHALQVMPARQGACRLLRIQPHQVQGMRERGCTHQPS